MSKENIVQVETIEVGEKVHVAARDDGSLVISKFVPIELDLPNDVLLGLAMEAHEQDITLNELICNMLREVVETDGECLGFEGYKPYCQDGVCTGCYNAPERCTCEETKEGNK